jgi:hypothetical protein
MLSSVLRSERVALMNVATMRAFVRLRQIIERMCSRKPPHCRSDLNAGPWNPGTIVVPKANASNLLI